MELLIEGIRKQEPKIDLEYCDLEMDNNKTIYYTYSVFYDKILDALISLNKVPEDVTKEEILKDIDDYVDKYYDELLEYFRDDAQEDAYENYEEDDPRGDAADRAYDEYRDSLLED